MGTFDRPDKLVDALQILDRHKPEIRTYYSSILQLQVVSEGIQKLIEAFRASVSERRGASFHRGLAAVEAFERESTDIVVRVNLAIERNPEEGHRILFESMAMLPNIDQKIASMFIKFLVVYLDVWPRMEPFLFVPLDRVVLKILREKLCVYSGPWEQSPSIKNGSGRLYLRGNRANAQYQRFLTFQTDFRRVANRAGVNAIIADELWLVGYVFCKEFPLCDRCWIREICEGSPFKR